MKKAMITALVSATLIGCHVDDTAEDIWPDPIVRTQVALRGINEAVVSYRSEHDTLPSTLDKLNAEQSRPMVLETDGWENALRFARIAGGYCAWSAGPDASFGTDDDLGIVGQVQADGFGSTLISGAAVRDRCENTSDVP